MATQVPVYSMPRSGKKIPTLDRTPPAEPALLDPRDASKGLMSEGEALERSAALLGQGSGQVAEALALNALRENERDLQRQDNEASARFTEQLNALTLEYEKRPELFRTIDDYEGEANAVLQSVMESIPDPDVREVFSFKATDQIQQSGLSLKRLAQDQKSGAEDAAFEDSIGEYAIAFGRWSATDEEKANLYASTVVKIRRHGQLIGQTPEEINDKIAIWENSTAVAEIENLITDDPNAAVERLQRPEDEMDDVVRRLGPKERAALWRSANSTANVYNAAQVKADKEARTELEEKTAKDGWTLISENRLTADWVKRNRNSLSTSEYKALLKGLGLGPSKAPEPGVITQVDSIVNDPDMPLEQKEAKLDELFSNGLMGNGSQSTEIYRSSLRRLRSNADPGAPGIFPGSVAFIKRNLPAAAQKDLWADYTVAGQADKRLLLFELQTKAVNEFEETFHNLSVSDQSNRKLVREIAEDIVNRYRPIRNKESATQFPGKLLDLPKAWNDVPGQTRRFVSQEVLNGLTSDELNEMDTFITDAANIIRRENKGSYESEAGKFRVEELKKLGALRERIKSAREFLSKTE